MAKQTGLLTWKAEIGGSHGHSFRTTFGYEGTLGGLGTFATQMAARSNARLNTRQYSVTYSHDLTAPAAGSNADRKAEIYMSHPDGTTVVFSYPDPVDADVEITQQGERIKASSLATIVANIATVTNIAYTPLYGLVLQRR